MLEYPICCGLIAPFQLLMGGDELKCLPAGCDEVLARYNRTYYWNGKLAAFRMRYHVFDSFAWSKGEMKLNN